MNKRLAAQFFVWFRKKARDQQAISGTRQAARNLRKQGVPIDYAVAILATG